MTPGPSSPLSDVVVLIPTHGRSTLLRRTLESVARCVVPPDTHVEIWIIENGSPGGVANWLEGISSPFKIRYRHHPAANKSGALNSVLPELTGRFVVFLDDDVRVDPELLGKYAEALRLARGRHYFGGAMLIDYEKEPPAWLKEYLPPSAKGWRPAPVDVPSNVTFFGCNWAAHADDLLSVGGFDAALGPGSGNRATGQEMDMQRRLQASGAMPVYLFDAVVWHYVPVDRCSTRWAIDRARKMAASSAMRLPDAVVVRQVAGLPTWLYRSFAESALMTLLSLPLGEQRRFVARYRLGQCLGTLDGLRLRARQTDNLPVREHV